MRLSLLAVAVVLMLSGCNTYLQDSYEKIYVSTPGVDNAACDLYTTANRYTVMTPRQVVVERDRLPMTVICKKTGYYQASVIVKPEIAAPGMGMNVANGFVPGALFDISSNSIYNYPDNIIVTLLPMPPQELPPDPAPYVLQKKPEEVKPAPVSSAPPAAAADKSMRDSGQK